MDEEIKKWLTVLMLAMCLVCSPSVSAAGNKNISDIAMLDERDNVIYIHRKVKPMETIMSLLNVKQRSAPVRNKRQWVNVGSHLLDKEAVAILDLHNKYRGMQQSSNMEYLTWSNQLAMLAQAWADNCYFEHGQIDMTTSYAGPIGQNLLATTKRTLTFLQGISLWYDEIEDYDHETGECWNLCGHYTQLVWHSSREVGCAIADCWGPNGITETSRTWPQGGIHMVCNYYPAGNVRGVNVFKLGPPCSECIFEKFWCQDRLCRFDCILDSTPCTCPNHCQHCGLINYKSCTCECAYGTKGMLCSEIEPVCDERLDQSSNCPLYPKIYCKESNKYFNFMKVTCGFSCKLCREFSLGYGCYVYDQNRWHFDGERVILKKNPSKAIDTTTTAMKQTTRQTVTTTSTTSRPDTTDSLTDDSLVTSTDKVLTDEPFTVATNLTGGFQSTEENVSEEVDNGIEVSTGIVTPYMGDSGSVPPKEEGDINTWVTIKGPEAKKETENISTVLVVVCAALVCIVIGLLSYIVFRFTPVGTSLRNRLSRRDRSLDDLDADVADVPANRPGKSNTSSYYEETDSF